ncbi:hypothetical protein GCM10010466_34360 [Planomonospora alba]|uniref:Uncharacterized protein n=1 Tax=Planomonospora alba TaxID=161354 RepID=A0ABP6N908_9ACTN
MSVSVDRIEPPGGAHRLDRRHPGARCRAVASRRRVPGAARAAPDSAGVVSGGERHPQVNPRIPDPG